MKYNCTKITGLKKRYYLLVTEQKKNPVGNVSKQRDAMIEKETIRFERDTLH